MNKEPKERIDPRAGKAWMLRGLMAGVLAAVVLVLYIVLAPRLFELPAWWGAAGFIPVALYVYIDAFLIPRLRLRFWRYEIKDDEIDILRGIFIKRRTLIPMVRVQHVDTEQGPVMRYYGLATLCISTAATNHRIPALPAQTAAALRGEISALAKVSEEDV